MKSQPRISVIMAVKNAASYLTGALDSVMAQTCPAAEVILVDGASTDGTADIAAGYPGVRLLQETGHGYASAWNDGIRAADGDPIAFLDSDDRWSPAKLRLQVDALRANPDARAAVGLVQFFAEPGRPLPSSFKPQLLERAHVAYMPGALLVHRDVFAEVGLFDTTWTIANDIDWFAQLKDRGIRVVVVPDVVIRKRVHDRNLSYLAAQTPAINSEMLHVLRRSIHRQRAARADAGPETADS